MYLFDLRAPDEFVEIFADYVYYGRVDKRDQEEQTSHRQIHLRQDRVHPYVTLAVYDMHPAKVKLKIMISFFTFIDIKYKQTTSFIKKVLKKKKNLFIQVVNGFTIGTPAMYWII